MGAGRHTVKRALRETIAVPELARGDSASRQIGGATPVGSITNRDGLTAVRVNAIQGTVMAPDPPPPPVSPPSRRRLIVLAVAVLVLVAALAAWAMRRGTPGAAEDCETAPPPNAFAVPACDDGSAPAGAKTATPPEPARPQP
jgi:hypothetical protein